VSCTETPSEVTGVTIPVFPLSAFPTALLADLRILRPPSLLSEAILVFASASSVFIFSYESLALVWPGVEKDVSRRELEEAGFKADARASLVDLLSAGFSDGLDMGSEAFGVKVLAGELYAGGAVSGVDVVWLPLTPFR